MIELRSPIPTNSASHVDLAAFCEAFSALATKHGVSNLVVYVGSPNGHALSYSDMTTLVTAEGAICKKINQFKNQSKNTVNHEQRSEE